MEDSRQDAILTHLATGWKAMKYERSRVLAFKDRSKPPNAFQCARHSLQEVAKQMFREEDADLVKARHSTYRQMLTCDDARLGLWDLLRHRRCNAEFHVNIGKMSTSGMENYIWQIMSEAFAGLTRRQTMIRESRAERAVGKKETTQIMTRQEAQAQACGTGLENLMRRFHANESEDPWREIPDVTFSGASPPMGQGPAEAKLRDPSAAVVEQGRQGDELRGLSGQNPNASCCWRRRYCSAQRRTCVVWTSGMLKHVMRALGARTCNMTHSSLEMIERRPKSGRQNNYEDGDVCRSAFDADRVHEDHDRQPR